MNRFLRVVTVLAGLLPAGPVPAAPLDAEAVIKSLHREPPATIEFAEARFSPLLDEPLIVSGQLTYLGAASFDRHVTAPYEESTAIRGESVRVERGGENARTFALKRAPELGGLLASFVGLLSGDASAVTREFGVTASGAAAAWTIELTPLDGRQRRRLQEIVVGGAGSEPKCIAVLSSQGGGTVMLLGEGAAGRLTAAATLESLLGQCRAE
ncbi:MAG TPA: LolA-related protein [Gammaproteobacteria bacterium]|nr:LolA-related protein [Gammaproteobacteria bacterium]